MFTIDEELLGLRLGITRTPTELPAFGCYEFHCCIMCGEKQASLMFLEDRDEDAEERFYDAIDEAMSGLQKRYCVRCRCMCWQTITGTGKLYYLPRPGLPAFRLYERD